MYTTQRFDLSKPELRKHFNKANMVQIWRNIAKYQLRAVEILDIVDYYDFNFEIESRINAIITDVLAGEYRASTPIIYKIEKKLGVCRHIIVPSPSDAVVIQTIVEAIREDIISKQPSQNAFYSRDKNLMKKPHEFDGAEYFSTTANWKRFQKEIYNFQSSYDFVGVTDLSNYYDSIDLDDLKKKVLSFVSEKEVFIDLLFDVINQIRWRPDYLERKSRGLPTINIEGIRLLGHLFIFSIDELLKSMTENSFARWMDDINFGVASIKDGCERLNHISDVLKSIGLALNLSKTDILDKENAQFQFEIVNNLYLDSVAKLIKSSSFSADDLRVLKERFQQHLTPSKKSKAWDKIAKRFLTQFAHLKEVLDDQLLANLYQSEPSVRQHIVYYLTEMGYSSWSSEVVLKITEAAGRYDDVSSFALCELVTVWLIPDSDVGREFIKAYERNIFPLSTDLDFYCQLWLKAKYYHPESLWTFIEKFKPKWEKSHFLRRQVTGVFLLPGSQNRPPPGTSK